MSEPVNIRRIRGTIVDEHALIAEIERQLGQFETRAPLVLDEAGWLTRARKALRRLARRKK